MFTEGFSWGEHLGKGEEGSRAWVVMQAWQPHPTPQGPLNYKRSLELPWFRIRWHFFFLLVISYWSINGCGSPRKEYSLVWGNVSEPRTTLKGWRATDVCLHRSGTAPKGVSVQHMTLTTTQRPPWYIRRRITQHWASLMAQQVKNLPAVQEALGMWVWSMGSGRFPGGGGNGNLFWYSCPGKPMDRGAWQASVQRVTKSLIWLSD